MRRATAALLFLPLFLGLSCGDQEPGTSPDPLKIAVPKPAPRPRPEKLNLILITLDTLRADALGIYGQERKPSPHIDQLGREGVVFDHAMTTNPETLPSHASILTGQWPHHHGVRANAGFILPEAEITLAEILKAAGYRTAAEIAAPVLRKETRITQGFTHQRGALSRNVTLKSVPTQHDSEKPLTRDGADITNRALEFMQRYGKDPFFLWLHYFDPHNPYYAPEAFRKKFKGSPYHAEVAYVDEQIGRLLEGLKRLSLDQDTVIVLTADHGEGLDDHGEPTHSYFVYDSTMRVPLILWAPDRLPGGNRISSLARTIDILPTVLELLGIPAPDELDGQSLLRMMKGAPDSQDRPAYGEATRFAATFNLPTLRYLSRGDWKYIHKTNPELYNVKEDPDELTNLANQHPDRVSQMRDELEALLTDQPNADTSAQAEIDSQIAAELIALGYVAHAPRMDIEAGESPLDLYGADPNSMVESAEGVAWAQGYLRRDKAQEALNLLEPIRLKAPESTQVLLLTARALSRLERQEEAIQTFGELLDLEPCEYKSRSELGVLLRDQGRYPDFVALLEDGAKACPLDKANRNDLAWLLATSSDETIRNGERAVAIMEDMLANDPRPTQAAYLDTFSVALATQGDFKRAEAVSRESLRLLEAANAAPEILDEVRGHLTSIRQGTPIRASAP